MAYRIHQVYPDNNNKSPKGPSVGIRRWMNRFIPSSEQTETVQQDWPAVRSGHRCAANKTHLFVYGGYDPMKTYGEFWVLNLTTKKWELVSNDCSSLSASSALLLNADRLYIFGGTGIPFGSPNSDEFKFYSLRSKSWVDLTSVSSGEKPSPRYGTSLAMDKVGKLYLYSGTEGNIFLDGLYCFDTQSLVWEKIVTENSSNPSAKYRHEVIFQHDKFFSLGGATLRESFGFEEIDMFHYESKKWSKVKTFPCTQHGFPSPRKAHSCVLFKNCMYMACGLTHDNGLITPLNDFWKLHLDNMVWEKLELKFPYNTYFHAASVTPLGCMYIFGGVREDPEKDISTWKRTSDLFQIWLDVPPLLEQAWTIFYKSFVEHCCKPPHTYLCDLGVPIHLVRRLDNFVQDSG